MGIIKWKLGNCKMTILKLEQGSVISDNYLIKLQSEKWVIEIGEWILEIQKWENQKNRNGKLENDKWEIGTSFCF